MKQEEKYMWVTIEGNLANLNKRALFLQSMVTMGKIWLYDELGNSPINPEFLPDTVEVLANDPHRSLAWLIHVFGGCQKSDIRYAQFRWGEYLRSKNVFPVQQYPPPSLPPTDWSWCQAHPYSPIDCYLNQTEDLIKRALPLGLKYAADPAAKYLPGWGPDKKKEPDCGWDFFGPSVMDELETLML
jgi:hypothetical protein